jgi:P27 family predicted phage terminase small subunit
VGLRGPKAKPVQLHLVRGNPSQLTRKELARRLKDEPKPNRALTIEAIDTLAASPRQKAIAKRILEVMPEGVLADVDIGLVHAFAAARETFEQANARITAETLVVKDLAHGGFKSNPFLRVRATAIEQMARIAIQLGLSPSARASIGAAVKNDPEAGDGDVWSEFVRGQSY